MSSSAADMAQCDELVSRLIASRAIKQKAAVLQTIYKIADALHTPSAEASAPTGTFSASFFSSSVPRRPPSTLTAVLGVQPSSPALMTSTLAAHAATSRASLRSDSVLTGQASRTTSASTAAPLGNSTLEERAARFKAQLADSITENTVHEVCASNLHEHFIPSDIPRSTQHSMRFMPHYCVPPSIFPVVIMSARRYLKRVWSAI
jgi:hypothetical protein